MGKAKSMAALEQRLMEEEDYGPLMAALPAYENFAKGILMEQRRGLTKTQMDVMMTLAFAGKMGMSQLAERVAVSREQASRAVSPLVERGFVVRARNPQQYRVVEVELTDAGRNFLESTREEINREVSEKLAPLSNTDCKRLMDASRTAVDILRKLQPSGVSLPPSGAEAAKL